jgi:hypothetical protein
MAGNINTYLWRAAASIQGTSVLMFMSDALGLNLHLGSAAVVHCGRRSLISWLLGSMAMVLKSRITFYSILFIRHHPRTIFTVRNKAEADGLPKAGRRRLGDMALHEWY